MARTSRRPVTFLERSEVDALLAEADRHSDSLAGIFALCYWAGLRLHEAVKVAWGDVRWEGEIPVKLYVIGKGGVEAWLALAKPLQGRLRRRTELRNSPDQPVFPSRWDRFFSHRAVQCAMVRFGEAAGIPRYKLHPHALRHSLGTHLDEAGVSPVIIRDIMRHANLSTTSIYLHGSIRRQREAFDLLA